MLTATTKNNLESKVTRLQLNHFRVALFFRKNMPTLSLKWTAYSSVEPLGETLPHGLKNLH